MNDQVYSIKCPVCEIHSSELTTFMDYVEKMLGKKWETLDIEQKIDLFKCFYDNIKLDQRTATIHKNKLMEDEQKKKGWKK